MLARSIAASFTALLLMLAACPASPRPAAPGTGTDLPTAPDPGPDPAAGSAADPSGGAAAGAGASVPPAPQGPKLGDPCGAADACGEGSCVTYRGIAGARGPALKSCEIACDAKGGCPDGRKCITIADGPGRVCR